MKIVENENKLNIFFNDNTSGIADATMWQTDAGVTYIKIGIDKYLSNEETASSISTDDVENILFYNFLIPKAEQYTGETAYVANLPLRISKNGWLKPALTYSNMKALKIVLTIDDVDQTFTCGYHVFEDSSGFNSPGYFWAAQPTDTWPENLIAVISNCGGFDEQADKYIFAKGYTYILIRLMGDIGIYSNITIKQTSLVNI